MTRIATDIWSKSKYVRIPLRYYHKSFSYRLYISLPSRVGCHRGRNVLSHFQHPDWHLHYRAVPETKTQIQPFKLYATHSFYDSESPILESQEFAMQQIMRMTTIPEATPTEPKISRVAFRKEKSNRATKKAETLGKSVIVIIWRTWDQGYNNARPHQQRIR
jgi:hypothetical protein